MKKNGLATHVVLNSNGSKIGEMNLVWKEARKVGPDFDELDPTADFSDGNLFGRPIGQLVDSDDDHAECGDDPLDILIARQEQEATEGCDRGEASCADLPDPYDFDEPLPRYKLKSRERFDRFNVTKWRMSCNETNCRKRKCDFTRRRLETIRRAHVSYAGTTRSPIAIPYRYK